MYRDTHLTQIATVTGKNRAIPGLHRDSFPGLTGQVQGRLLRQVTFTKLYCRAVSGQTEWAIDLYANVTFDFHIFKNDYQTGQLLIT